MQSWYNSDYCEGRQHCKNCRLSKDFRAWVASNYSDIVGADFECPFGITGSSVKQQFPPLRVEATNAAKALGRVAKNIATGKRVKVTAEEEKRRIKICESNNCKQFKNGRCLKCGCVTKWKSRLQSESCPLGYWKKTEAPSLTHGWKHEARAMVLPTIHRTLGKQLIAACEDRKIHLEITGVPGNYGRYFRKKLNIITWGVKIATWWYHGNKANVLYMENGLLGQRNGIWIDARGWFSESNLCKHRHYDEAYTEADMLTLGNIIQKHFHWDLLQGGNPDGPIMYVVQSANDAPCQFHFPYKSKMSGLKMNTIALGLKLASENLPDRPVIVRPHPRFHKDWKKGEETYKQYMRPDWQVDWSKDVYQTLKTCSAIVGINSTTLTEALTLGIPVAALGDSAYTGSKTILECSNDPKRLKHLYDWKADKEDVFRYLGAIVRHHTLKFYCDKQTIAKNKEFQQWAARLL